MTSIHLESSRTLISLLCELSRYGLNPSDWHIQRQPLHAGDSFFLHHKNDESFRLGGKLSRTRQGRTRLKDLEVLSL